MFELAHIQNNSLLKSLMKPLLDFAVKITVSGRENIPISKPFVLVSNHRSDMDPLIISSIMDRYVAWVADSFLFNVPILCSLLSAVGTIPVSTKTQEYLSALKQSGQLLHHAQAVGIFPEGHTSLVNGHSHHLGTFNSGFAEMALHNRTSVLPVTIISQKEFVHPVRIPGFMRDWFGLPNDVAAMQSRVMYRKVHVRIDAPIAASSFLPDAASQPSTHRFKTAVNRLVGQTHDKISENLDASHLKWV